MGITRSSTYEMTNSVKMKSLDRVQKLHLLELERFYLAKSPSRSSEAELSESEADELRSAFEEDANRKRRRGRPPAHRTSNQRTFQSLQVFVFVIGELRTFRMRHGIQRIPIEVQIAFIEFARRMYPLADEEIIYEHIRKDQRLLPQYDEPTCFELIRYEYEDGKIANVIVAGPADDRLKRCG